LISLSQLPSIAAFIDITVATACCRNCPPSLSQLPAVATALYRALIAVAMVSLYDTFAYIREACEAINRHVLDDGESYRVYKSDSKRHILVCKDKSCSFEI
jgi:hypothetical protein